MQRPRSRRRRHAVPNSDTPGGCTPPFRGSKRHILEWLDQPGFLDELNALLHPAPVRLDESATYLPKGTSQPREARLDSFGKVAMPHPTVWSDLRQWWLVHTKGANTPNWDFASTCLVHGVHGLLLIEAKANAEELGVAGKTIALTVKGQERSQAGLQKSRANHDRICGAIGEASEALSQLHVTSPFSASSHYQFANRLAFVWKLASLGIPTALLYLGFVGDRGLDEGLRPFKDDREWLNSFGDHVSSILPSKAADIEFRVGKTSALILTRSRQVLTQSPSIAV